MRGCRYGKGLIYYYYEYYYYDYYHLFPFKGCIQRIQNPLSLSFLFESLATHASVKITVLIYILSIFFFFSFISVFQWTVSCHVKTYTSSNFWVNICLFHLQNTRISLARKLLYLAKCYFILLSDPDLRQDPVFPRCCLSKWSLQELFGKTDRCLGF